MSESKTEEVTEAIQELATESERRMVAERVIKMRDAQIAELNIPHYGLSLTYDELFDLVIVLGEYRDAEMDKVALDDCGEEMHGSDWAGRVEDVYEQTVTTLQIIHNGRIAAGFPDPFGP